VVSPARSVGRKSTSRRFAAGSTLAALQQFAARVEIPVASGVGDRAFQNMQGEFGAGVDGEVGQAGAGVTEAAGAYCRRRSGVSTNDGGPADS